MSGRKSRLLFVTSALALFFGVSAALPQGLKCWVKSIGDDPIASGCVSEEWYSGVDCYPVNTGCPF